MEQSILGTTEPISRISSHQSNPNVDIDNDCYYFNVFTYIRDAQEGGAGVSCATKIFYRAFFMIKGG